MNLMEQSSNISEAERTLPQVKFAQYVSKGKLSLGMKAILSRIKLETHQDLQLRAITYACWWYEKHTNRTLANLAQELGVAVEHFAVCLGFE